MLKQYKGNSTTLALIERLLWESDIFEGISAKELAEITGVNIKTARRWLKNSHGISAGNQRMLEHATRGHVVPESWQPFFKFVNDYAVIDDAYSFDPEQMRLYWLVAQEKQILQRDKRLLTVKLDQAQQYIAYLEQQVTRAKVLAFPASKARPSATAGKDDNPFFSKK